MQKYEITSAIIKYIIIIIDLATYEIEYISILNWNNDYLIMKLSSNTILVKFIRI